MRWFNNWRLAIVLMIGTGAWADSSSGALEILNAPETVERFGRVEISIRPSTSESGLSLFDAPVLLLRRPDGFSMELPAFPFQNYERRVLTEGNRQRQWLYPVGECEWRVRFSPDSPGVYTMTARGIGGTKTYQSAPVRFECRPSDRKGFVRAGRKDPRFFEFTDGEPFFPIGQNLAFIGEGQYASVDKAQTIFKRLSEQGANFVRLWTCCDDWALAIEAPKNAWERSWNRKKDRIAILPDDRNTAPGRRYLRLDDAQHPSIPINPSHPVALRPDTDYVLRGRFFSKGSDLNVSFGRTELLFRGSDLGEGLWIDFKMDYRTEPSEFWMPSLTLTAKGTEPIWVDALSLREDGNGPELLWEADPNRPARGYYNQLDSFMLDLIVDAAERHDIYMMLCVITRDLYMEDLKTVGSPAYKQAIADAINLMRYVVARWGYSTHVGAWEFFNEMDPGVPTDSFYEALNSALETMDIHHHLIGTSTWSPSARDCRLECLDIAMVHHYLRVDSDQPFQSAVAAVENLSDFLRKNASAKPALIAEFGLATPQWGQSDWMRKDSEGIHFHNALWASTFAGLSGTTLFWWWEEVDRQRGYVHYQPLAAYMQNESFAGMEVVRLKGKPDALDVWGYRTERLARLWLYDSAFNWWQQVAEKREPARIASAEIPLKDVVPGTYTIEWWDPWTGRILRRDSVHTQGTLLLMEPPSFIRDLACKIFPSEL